MEATTFLTLALVLVLIMIGWKTVKKAARAIDDMIKVTHSGVKFGLNVAESAIATGEVNNEFNTSKKLGKLYKKITKAKGLSNLDEVKKALKKAQTPAVAPEMTRSETANVNNDDVQRSDEHHIG